MIRFNSACGSYSTRSICLESCRSSLLYSKNVRLSKLSVRSTKLVSPPCSMSCWVFSSPENLSVTPQLCELIQGTFLSSFLTPPQLHRCPIRDPMQKEHKLCFTPCRPSIKGVSCSILHHILVARSPQQSMIFPCSETTLSKFPAAS